MDIDTIEDQSEATVTFEQELERLVLASYACGVRVEDTWEIQTPLTDTPNWTILIEKSTSDDTSIDESHVLDE